MGALNCRLQNVHIPTTGVELSHLTTLKVRFAMLISSESFNLQADGNRAGLARTIAPGCLYPFNRSLQ
jgi:hypothetical protein